jgi:hypothetical protein
MGDRDHGEQPVGRLLEQWGLGNHELVEASTEQLSHKQVQKARKGRQLTLHMMQKVTRALNIAIWTRLSDEQKEQFVEYRHADLFTYAKGFRDDWRDPNAGLMP